MTSNKHETKALQYLKAGWNVIPLGAASKVPNGKALISTGHKKIVDGKVKGSWEIFQEEQVTNDLVASWWKHTPKSNIGIIAGKISKIVVVDIDPRNGGKESMKQLHLPPTYIVNTGGGGWHYYYIWNGEQDAPNFEHLDGIDLKGDGGYVVAPPSIHDKTKKEYEPATEMDEITEAPDWLYKVESKPKEKLWEAGIDGTEVGKRNDTTASMCGKILTSLPKKLWKTAGWGGLKEWNNINPEPLPETELRTVFDSICQTAKGKNQETNDSIAKRIVSLVMKASPTLLHDDLHKTYMQIGVDGHNELHPISSRRFKDWVTREFWKKEKKTVSSDQIKQALGVFHAKAIFEGEVCDLYIRSGEAGDDLWYDLADAAWRAVKITRNGWSIDSAPPNVFKRFSHQLPQATPSKGGDMHRLLDYVNITDKSQRLLLLVYVVSCFIPNIPHPIPVLHGSQGSAKSTFMRLLRKIIDPSKTELLSLPTKADQLVQQLSHHWTPFYDNITSITPWISDALCRAVTGDGFTKRELYTNDEDVVYSFRCCIGLNGINIAAQKADLLDRSILFGLERIPPEKRKDEKTFWAEFEEDRPLILGAALDALSAALRIHPQINVTQLPRMADFAIWGRAIAEALGYTQEDFVNAYEENMNQQNDEALREHPVATAILAFMVDKDEWVGTSSSLLVELEQIAPQEKIDLRQKLWPKAANVLSRRINEAKTNLANAGIVITTSHTQKRLITIRNCKSIVDIVEPLDNDNNNDSYDTSATNEQDTLKLIQEHLDPNARYSDE